MQQIKHTSKQRITVVALSRIVVALPFCPCQVNVELFTTDPCMEKFSPIYLYNRMFLDKTLLPRTRQILLNYKFIQQSVVASSKAVVEDVTKPNICNAAEKVAVLISEERQCSADVQTIGLYHGECFSFLKESGN